MSLKWNNHKLAFIHVLGILRDKELYTDATIACEGILYNVHKLVLSTCSDYFSDILEKIKCKNPVIILKDIKHKDLEALLDYMYLGEVNVQQGDLTSLIKVAECLRIKGLAESDEEISQKKLKPNDHKMDRWDSSFTPPAKRKKRDTENVSDSLQHNGSDSFTNRYSGTPKSKRSVTPICSYTQKEATNMHLNTETVQEMFPQVIIPKLEDTTSTACSTITNLVDPVIKEEGDEIDGNLECYTLGDDSLYKDEDKIKIIPSIGRGHDNIENALPSLLEQVKGEMLQNNTYEQSSLTNSSVMQLDGSDDHEGSPYSFSVARSTKGDESLTNSFVGADSRYGHFMSSDQAAGDSANAMSSRCLVCNKIFTGAKTKFRLERHMFTHTGQRPYQCLMCDYRAGLKEHLTRHIKSQHSLQK